MPDFIDRLGAELTRAATAEPRPSRAGRVSWRPRWLGSMRLRGLLIVPALAILGTGAALAAGILLTGAPAGPKVPPVPTAGYGAAIARPRSCCPSTWPTRLAVCRGGCERCAPLAVTCACRSAGWPTARSGRSEKTGRLATITASTPSQTTTRTRGAVRPWTRAATASPTRSYGGCRRARWRAAGALPTFSRRQPIPCPTQDTRDVYFGLLGPDAASISYVSGGGRTVTVPTVGPDGAYLIVTRARPGEQQGDSSGFVALLKTGPIRAVTYRDGHTCRPTAVYPCAPIGLVPANGSASHAGGAGVADPRPRDAGPLLHAAAAAASRSATRREWPSPAPAASTTSPCSSLPTPRLPRDRHRLGNDHQHPRRATTGRQPSTSLPAATASSADSSDITPPARSTAPPPSPTRQTQATSPSAGLTSTSPNRDPGPPPRHVVAQRRLPD